MEMLLELRNVVKRFGALAAVNDVSFKVEENELIALIGPNGAGKTTLFNLIAGKLFPDAGEIIFKGENIANMPPNERVQKGIMLSFQIPSLFKSFSALQNVRVSLLVKEGKNLKFFTRIDDDQELKEKSSQALDYVGIPQSFHPVNCELLPGGAKKSLDVAVALAQEPYLLLLDEPTAGLGFSDAAKVLEVVKRIWKDGKTVIFTEHDLDVVFTIAQRIIVMDEGKIIADGEPEKIKKNSAVRRIYGF